MVNFAAYGWIALGSGLGGACRYACSRSIAAHVGETFPWGTLAVNVAGSLIIGAFMGLTGPGGPMPAGIDLRHFAATGFCGGFTTVSSFSLQTLELARNRNFAEAAGNVLLSILACMIGAWLGYSLGRSI